ncbi:hypothetical protein [Sphingomonas sp. CROZ-RG-20F-R02-07]|uniref:antitoxin n=1 Tax=Sphingomonas sp. CROZ-RG-20F-R02-07 TaxID=2914832 RepID=UPI001F591481|nr:hypothetical protein [Sphingomonas sp. CROZ-RG-20F-R02-07]
MNDTAKIFWTGRSQAVRLPKAYRFLADEVRIYRRADGAVVLEPIGSDEPVHAPADAAAHRIERLREAITEGLESGPAADWDVNEIKAASRSA